MLSLFVIASRLRAPEARAMSRSCCVATKPRRLQEGVYRF